MPVERVVAAVQLAADKPPIERRLRVVEDALGLPDPVD
jgi:hypothetical protein